MAKQSTQELTFLDSRFKILVATDCHLGYEAKCKRAQEFDSIITFEEILKTAKDRNVDFVLLAGDLFHDAKPSQRIVLESMNLLKKYCTGNKAIPFEFLSNPEDIFPNKAVNYEDPNLNISVPVFSIHGNHDNPSFESTGTLDILMASGFINYFGKWNNLKEINVTPMIFQKGASLLAIYGLGNLTEQRLSRLLREGKVHFLRPSNLDNCFNILVLHQNRARHAENEYIEEDRFPSWFHLIIWGHEHECRISPEEIQCREGGYYDICQPGSSVATSLSEGESVPKHIGLLFIEKDHYKMNAIKLKTVRPFIFRDIFLPEIIEKGYCDFSNEGIIEYIDDYILNTAIPAGVRMLSGHEEQPKKPLIRLRIFYTQDNHVVDVSQLSHKYSDLVSNVNDMILFKRYRKGQPKKVKNDHFDDITEDITECFQNRSNDPLEWTKTVQSGINKYFEKHESMLKVMSLAGLNEATHRFVIAGDDEAFAQVMEHQMKKSIDYLMTKDFEVNQESVMEELQKYRETRLAASGEDEELRELQEMLNDPVQRNVLKLKTAKVMDTSSDNAGGTGTGRGGRRGRGRGRGAAGEAGSTSGTRGRAGRSRGKPALNVSVIRDPSPGRGDGSDEADTKAFRRFAAPSNQPNTSTIRVSKSQKSIYCHSSDSE
ncbi:double-strand break repair protein MRE11 [Diachasmimorpha longicaudata]|uniref:double-strand break repair protein MRE11 n=1 Tax=Diachasmimorpha longicaudata TaxID=58733 RepID=UPI0030B88242